MPEQHWLLSGLIAGIACLGFGIVFNLRGKRLFLAALGGAISWTTFLFVGSRTTDLMSSFLATVAVTIYAELMARLTKTPVTAYLVVALLPLVPGSGIYYTMRYFLSGDSTLFLESGRQTVAIAGSLAVGILPVFSLTRLYGRIHSHLKGGPGATTH